MSRGTNDPHKKKKAGSKEEEAEAGTARVSMDYFYFSQEDEKASKNPMLVMVDEEVGEKYARVVAKKGASDMDWIITDMSRELKSWGHAGGPEGNTILQGDGEHSVEDVNGALA